MKNKIIVFPASIWQAGLIKYLKKIDYFVYSLDDSCEAIGHKFSDRRVDIKSNEINKLRNFVNSNNSKIISCSSDLGQKLINKIYYKKNNIFNKFKQREIQKKINLDTPLFFSKKKFNLKNFNKCNSKVICKPMVGSGSKDITYLTSYKKLKDENLIYEEYIDGIEYNAEGFLYKKEIFLYSLMEKKKLRNSKSVSYILKNNSLSNKAINKIKSILLKFILESDYPNGPFHIEIIRQLKTNKIFIIEGHPREAGFDMFFFTCKKITGLDLYKNSINIKTNKKIDINNLKTKEKFKYFCCRMIPIEKNGLIKEIKFKKFKDDNNIKTYIKLFNKKNDTLIKKNNDSSRIGYIQSFTNDKKINLEKYTLSILKKYFVLKYN